MKLRIAKDIFPTELVDLFLFFVIMDTDSQKKTGGRVKAYGKP